MFISFLYTFVSIYIVPMIHHTLKQLRKSKGITQTQMAELLHKSQNAYSLLESGQSKIDAAIIPAICQVFNITPNEFFDFEPEGEVDRKQVDLVEIIRLLKAELDKKNELLKLCLTALSEVERITENNRSLISFLNITKNHISSQESY